MKAHLKNVNEKVDEILYPQGKPLISESISKLDDEILDEEEEKESEEVEEQEEMEDEEEITPKEFVEVTPYERQDSISSEKHLPSLSNWAKGVTSFERNWIDETTTKSGNFKKILKLLNKKKK